MTTTASPSEEKKEIPIPFNQTPPDKKITIGMKMENAWKMILNQGVGAFAHKVNKIIYRKWQDFIRALFQPDGGKKLREEALKALKNGEKLPTLSIVITVMGQHDLTIFCLNKLISNQAGEIEIVIMDGKGDFEIKEGELSKDKPVNIRIVRDKEAYPAFDYWMQDTKGDLMFFMHNDIIIEDYGFDALLRYTFFKYPKLGIVGFVGSDEMDKKGSRSWGTTSNFLGKTYTFKGHTWKGKGAMTVGWQRYDGISPSVAVDGCAITFSRKGWSTLSDKKLPMPYYDYDRIMCCRYLEAGWRIATLGVACDHISNMTAATEMKWHENVKEIGIKLNIPRVNDSSGKANWDISLHDQSKRLFLKEWRDEKHFIPRSVDWKI
jgi:hypothetical protein